MLQGNHYYILESSGCLEQLLRSRRCNNSSGRQAQVLSPAPDPDLIWKPSCPRGLCPQLLQDHWHTSSRVRGQMPWTESQNQAGSWEVSCPQTEPFPLCLAYKKLFSQNVLENFAKTTLISYSLLCQSHQSYSKADSTLLPSLLENVILLPQARGTHYHTGIFSAFYMKWSKKYPEKQGSGVWATFLH